VNSFLRKKTFLALACLFFYHSAMGGTMPPDPYEEIDKYVGTVTRAGDPPKPAKAFLKFNPPLWPLSLFSDDISIEVTINEDSSPRYFASLSAPRRVLGVRDGPYGHFSVSVKSAVDSVPLLESGTSSKIGELGNGRFAFRTSDIFFEGYYKPADRFCCWFGSSGPTRRQLYHGVWLPLSGAALAGSFFGGISAKRCGISLLRGALSGAFCGFLLLPVLLILLIATALLWAAIASAGLAVMGFMGLL
jgi:hypothetical protein